MTRKNGIGARLKVLIENIEPRIKVSMPAPPPRKISAPTMLVTKNAKATGSDSAIRTKTVPSINTSE